MAVKASASVTITAYRDTENVTRYYKLQSSDSVPEKPTSNPPSGWTDTEPTYTSGSTNSLYFCDLMVFSDGTWAYSEVSKSSSYEAAKEAYNKAAAASDTAQAAQDEVNAISDKTRSGYIETLSGSGFVQSTKTEDGGTAEVVVYGKSVQDGTPSPEAPVEIQSVESPKVTVCGKNLFDKENANALDAYIDKNTIISGYSRTVVFIPCKPNTTYTISRIAIATNERFRATYSTEFPAIGTTVDDIVASPNSQAIGNLMKLTITTPSNAKYLIVWSGWEDRQKEFETLQIEESSTVTDYEPYTGKTVTLSDIVLRSIPNIAQDKLFKDTDGLWKVERNCAYISSYNGESITTSYYSNTGELSTGAFVVYALEVPTYETLPDSIQAELNALTTYNPVTNVIASDGVTPDIDVSFWTRDHAAKEEAAAAAKVATNFLSYDSTNGLLIGNKTSGEWSGYRSQMLPTAFNILDASGNTLSSFGANDIELGLNNDDATINLCNGQAMLKATGDDGALTDFMLYSDKRLVMRAYRSALINCYRSEGYYSQIHVDSYDPDDTSFNGQISLRTYGLEKGATLDVNYDGINLNVTGAAESDGTIRLYRIMEVNRDEINAYADFNLLSNTFYGDRIRCMFNGHGIAGVDSSGNQVNMMYVGTTDILNVGGGSAPPSKILVNSISETSLKTKNAGVMLDDDGTSTTYDGYFHPTTDNKVSCGRTSYRWTRVYAANSSISTSDKRQKKNIKPIKEKKYKKVKNNGKVEEVDLYSELFDKFQPCEYEFIEGEQRVNFGLIAQDVLEAMAELGIEEDELDLVYHDIETVKESMVEIDSETGEEKLIETEKEVESFGLAYENIIAMLINEVQNLKAEIYKIK